VSSLGQVSKVLGHVSGETGIVLGSSSRVFHSSIDWEKPLKLILDPLKSVQQSFSFFSKLIDNGDSPS